MVHNIIIRVISLCVENKKTEKYEALKAGLKTKEQTKNILLM